MNNLETDEGTEQLVASEASAGAKGGGDDSANARHCCPEGMFWSNSI
jgi:hypothetical protein